jgi:hypothetical protein
MAKRKIPYPCQESNPSHPAHSLVDILIELPWLPMHTYAENYLNAKYSRRQRRGYINLSKNLAIRMTTFNSNIYLNKKKKPYCQL